jgi:hypothetical protein
MMKYAKMLSWCKEARFEIWEVKVLPTHFSNLASQSNRLSLSFLILSQARLWCIAQSTFFWKKVSILSNDITFFILSPCVQVRLRCVAHHVYSARITTTMSSFSLNSVITISQLRDLAFPASL